MAKTALERKREQLERDGLTAKQQAFKIDAYFQQSFDDWMGERWHGRVTHDFDLIGADSHLPFPGVGNADPFWREDLNEGPNRGAIGVAERAVDVLLDAAVELAGLINVYKTEQLNARIGDLEVSDLSDPGVRKQALADIVMLTKYRDQLEKQVRWTLPQWRVRGV